ncbi:MAG: hypothetical protein AABM66_06465 [Actinomycetota bacterium]
MISADENRRRDPGPWHDPGVRRIEVAERRARLARRHRLAPGHRAGDVVEVLPRFPSPMSKLAAAAAR